MFLNSIRSRKVFRLIWSLTIVATIVVLYSFETAYLSKSSEFFALISTVKNNLTKRCKWPPDSTEQLFDPTTGRYDLTLRPCVHPSVGVVDPCTTDDYKRLLSFYHGPPLTNKSCLRQMVEMDEYVRMNREEPNYSLYPEMGNVLELVAAIREGKTVKTRPTNDPILGIIRQPRGFCDGNSSAYSLNLIVLIKTCVDCEIQRHHARETYMRANLWGSFRVQFVFVVGLPGSNQSEWMQFEGLRVRNPTKVFKDAVATRASLLNESDHFRDMLIGDFIDSYYNLTLKQVMTFRWVSAFCRYTSPVYFFIDNDYSLVPSNVIKMIKRTPDKLKLRLNGGTFGPLRAVLRPTNPQNARRWDMSVNEIPWTNYPQYSSGAAYVVGASLVTDAAIAMAYTRFLRFDDAYLGFVWNKLHAPVMIIPGMKHTVIHSPLTEDAISIPFREADQLVDWSTGTIRKKTPTDTKLKKKKE